MLHKYDIRRSGTEYVWVFSQVSSRVTNANLDTSVQCFFFFVNRPSVHKSQCVGFWNFSMSICLFILVLILHFSSHVNVLCHYLSYGGKLSLVLFYPIQSCNEKRSIVSPRRLSTGTTLTPCMLWAPVIKYSTICIETQFLNRMTASTPKSGSA